MAYSGCSQFPSYRGAHGADANHEYSFLLKVIKNFRVERGPLEELRTVVDFDIGTIAQGVQPVDSSISLDLERQCRIAMPDYRQCLTGDII